MLTSPLLAYWVRGGCIGVPQTAMLGASGAGVNRSGDGGSDSFDVGHAVDADELALCLVVRNERCGLREIRVEADLEALGIVVGSALLGVAMGDAGHQFFRIDLETHDTIDLLAVL